MQWIILKKVAEKGDLICTRQHRYDFNTAPYTVVPVKIELPRRPPNRY